MCKTPFFYHFLSFPPPPTNSESCQCLRVWVVGIEEWDQRHQEAISLRWSGDLGHRKNGRVANSCLGEQTNTTTSVCLCTMFNVFYLSGNYRIPETFQLCQWFKIKSALMAGNKAKQGIGCFSVLAAISPQATLSFSLCHLSSDFDSQTDALQLQWAALE